jgi:succinyl-CoA--D-citramalate CoA-transferase
LKVIELGSMLAGPFVGSMLGDFGAEVIKVEKPGKPDSLREWPPMRDGKSVWWKTMSRNKRLITLDISKAAARPILLDLLGSADIVIENFRPGTMERWGYGPEELEAKFPKLIWVRVSGYGQDGPYKDRGGYATIAEAFSGLASFTGFADRGPMVSSFPMGDYLAGLFGAFGALAAVHERGSSGNGQVIDVSLFEPLLRIIEMAVVRFDQTGAKKPLLGNQMEEDVPRNIYPTKDGGHIALSVGSQSLFNNLLDMIGRSDLKTDPGFDSMDARIRNRTVVDQMVRDWIAAETTADALEQFESHRLVAGKVNDIEDLFADPHVAARGALALMPDEEFGPIKTSAPVPKLSRTPGSIQWSGGLSGADNEFVLHHLLGIDRERLTALTNEGII